MTSGVGLSMGWLRGPVRGWGGVADWRLSRAWINGRLPFEGVDLLAADEWRTLRSLDVRGDPHRAVNLPLRVPVLPPVAACDPSVVVLAAGLARLAVALGAPECDDTDGAGLGAEPLKSLACCAVGLYLAGR